MSLPVRFLLYNLLPAMMAGALLWLIVQASIGLLGIRHGRLRLCLLAAPLIKSTLVLLALQPVMLWPVDVFGAWYARAVPAEQVLPPFILLGGAALLARSALVARARRDVLAGAWPARGSEPRLGESMARVMGAYRSQRGLLAARCRCDLPLPEPRLLVTERGGSSPLVVTDGAPVVVFPRQLVAQLQDPELDGALAHEVAHLALRRRAVCVSSETLRVLVTLNPMASLMAAQLHREEEKACDDLAVAAVGEPDTYAGMLLKSYRFAARQPGGVLGTLQYVPQLLGVRPELSERVERLLEGESNLGMGKQYLAFGVAWAVVLTLFFTA